MASSSSHTCLKVATRDSASESSAPPRPSNNPASRPRVLKASAQNTIEIESSTGLRVVFDSRKASIRPEAVRNRGLSSASADPERMKTSRSSF